jgi:hypothetical protein
MRNEKIEKISTLLNTGTPEQISEALLGLLPDPDPRDMWYLRARALTLALTAALCELRDRGEIELTPQLLRENLQLGKGQKGPGLIPLHLRALNGELSDEAKRQLRGLFDALPGFSLEAALRGEGQPARTTEQTGYLTMQLSKPLGMIADEICET